MWLGRGFGGAGAGEREHFGFLWIIQVEPGGWRRPRGLDLGSGSGSGLGFRDPTCALLEAAASLAVHPQPAAKVLLPELGKPHVPAVVGQRAALEVSVEG